MRCEIFHIAPVASGKCLGNALSTSRFLGNVLSTQLASSLADSLICEGTIEDNDTVQSLDLDVGSRACRHIIACNRWTRVANGRRGEQVARSSSEHARSCRNTPARL